MRVSAPLTVVLIALMLWLTFGRASDVLIVMASLPVALAGGVWLLWGLDFHISVAVLIGFIALSGVAVSTARVLLLYLNLALTRREVLAAGDGAESDEPGGGKGCCSHCKSMLY